jgi:integrase
MSCKPRPESIPIFSVTDKLSFSYIFPSINIIFSSLFPTYNNHGLHNNNDKETFVYLLFNYGLRFSELSAITSKDVFSVDMILIRGKKGSNSTIIKVPDLMSQILYFGYTKNDLHLFPQSYFSIYNFMLLHNLNNFYYNKTNKIVTHGGRHKLADDIRNVGTSELAGECLRHKSKKNIVFYGNKKAGKNGNN